jgi:hypothetical protein
MAKKRHRTYEPRMFDRRIIESDEIEQIHEEILACDPRGGRRLMSTMPPLRPRDYRHSRAS